MALTRQREELPKAYEPREVEDRIYQFWMEGGYFTPKIDPQKKPFVIIMPPPNVTGELHLGHALTATLEDIMIRWHRMRGEPSLWLPGVDHAGIATQVVVEQRLAEEGLTKQELGQEKFAEKAWEWASQCRATIMEQHKKLGASCDWSRERFTLDEGPSRAVRTTFVNLYNKGLIYQGERIINWCPRCQTALSDLEVEHKELTGHLYYIKYPLVEEPGFITLATTRPETMFGDVAVAVNPNHPRFSGFLNKKVAIPVINRPIPVIADEAVDPSFGTGALKITPSHDPVDFEVAQRHDLPLINTMNSDATLNEEAGPYAGFDRFKCREDLLSRLRREGLLAKEPEPYSHSVGHCARCNTIIEPWVSKQWFIKMAPLAGPAIRAVQEGEIAIIPEQFTKVYLHWMENIRDWCISRQLWWGHRIPAWHCADCGFTTVSIDEPKECANCGSADIYQEPDVLDTWFSSALWPHSTLGWPDDTEDLRYFYPTTVMETGYDILFFWVARMIMMGLENTGNIPFHTVYLHGLIRDEKGEKMSKLKGNVINPLDVIQRYGVDALRFALTTGGAPGNDVRVSDQKFEAGRNFANKLWNAARFVIGNLETSPETVAPPWDLVVMEDRWIWSRLNRLMISINSLLEDFQFGEAERQIHDFIWGEFCDWYIELAKIRLRQQGSPSPIPVLVQVLETSLRLLHPFMPFVTEEIWQSLVSYLPQDEQKPLSLMIASYPVAEEVFYPEAEREMESVIEIVRSIRNARAEFEVKASAWIEAQIYAENRLAIELQSQAISTLARTQPLTILNRVDRKGSGDKALVLVLRDADVVLPMGGMVDLDAERRRLEREIEACQTRIDSLKVRLSDAAFLSKSPSFVVEKEKGKLSESQGRLDKLRERVKQLEKM
jgi:valyl-tRNA synthetase